MAGNFISRGFRGRERIDPAIAARIPPGQYLETDFPVLSAGPTPRASLDRWEFSITGAVDSPKQWSWLEFMQLPSESVTVDIHCVTKWSKLDTVWQGVSIDTVMNGAAPLGNFVTAFCDGGYTTNLPLDDLLGGKAWIAFGYDGQALAPEHGGPARLLAPHLYFWKSAKWIQGLEITLEDEPGFWEQLGYHNYGDPWREQRYQGD